MDFSKYLTWGAVIAALGTIASLWERIKAIAWRAVSFLIQQVEIPTSEMQTALIAYLIENYKHINVYDKVYGAINESRRDGRYGLTAYEIYGQRSIIFKNGRWPFWFSKTQNETPNQESHHDHQYEHHTSTVKITFFRGKLDIDSIIAKACQARNEATWRIGKEGKEESRFTIYYVPEKEKNQNEYAPSSDGLPWYLQSKYRLIGLSADTLGRASISTGKALDSLVFPRKTKDLIGEIDRWVKSREWYQRKNIPWKRGWLLYGPPGTGKTALARAFAEDMQLPIYVFNLAQMDNNSLMKAWAKMQVNTPCIALIEDMDNIFHGRENVTRKNSNYIPCTSSSNDNEEDDENKANGNSFGFPLTFDCLLNCLDGVEKSEGIFTIITANDLTKIDSALGVPHKLESGGYEFISTRPGRIDKAIELTYIDTEDMKIMASRILEGYDDALLVMMEYINRQNPTQETPAQFQERCCQIALECYWNSTKQEEELAIEEVIVN